MNGYVWIALVVVGAFCLPFVVSFRGLRIVYRTRRDAAVRTDAPVFGMRELRQGGAGMEPSERARRAGVDELTIDDYALWSERAQ